MLAPAVRALLLLGCLFPASACRATRPSQLPTDARWLVAVKSAPLDSSWWTSFAHHAYLDLVRDGRPERIESGGRLGILHGAIDPDDLRTNRRFDERAVRVLGWLDGEAARTAIERIDAALPALVDAYRDGYTRWPGPNSNTFVRELLAGVPELGFVFDPNCVGKDFAWLGAGFTASKTGLRVDTPVLGAAVGLREGVELHVLQLTLGLSLDPPGLSLPFLPQIPFGWLGAEPVPLAPPPDDGALRLDLDAAACDGEWRSLGPLALPGRVYWVPPDGAAWVAVRCGALTPGPVLQSHAITFDVERHAQDGVSSHTQDSVFYREGPVSLRTQRGETVVWLQMALQPDGRLQVAARAFRDFAHESAVMERERR